MLKPELWGALRDRYAAVRPRKMLSIDGGGIRGVLSLQILEQIESIVGQPLGAYFDYIAGTSTGAIIAAGLAQGMSVGDLTAFYRKTGPEMFEKSHLLRRWQSLYKSDPLKAQLQTVFGENRTLKPDDLRTLLLVVTRNATTDSPWPVSSNPEARYNDPKRADCNLQIPLWQLVRASTAAPVFFPPEVLNWDPADPDKTFVFVDGGITPYNNPAFLLYRMATHPAYQLAWPTGEKNLLLISVGTGDGPTLGLTPDDPTSNLLSIASGLPSALMYGTKVEQDVACRTIGRCTYGSVVDRELLDMVPRQGPDVGTLEERVARPPVSLDQDCGRHFLYARYDADLTDKGLRDLGLPELKSGEVSKMDNATPENIEALIRIGHQVGKQVEREHFGSFLPK